MIPRRLAAHAAHATRSRVLGLRRPLAAAATTVRAYSSSPSANITVVPFAQTPEQARERMLVHGLLASAQWSNVFFAGLIRLFGRDMEDIGRELGLGESLVLRDMKPAYYPIWRVDAIAEGSVSPAQGGQEGHGWLAVREGYLPGNAYAPLSYISYAVPPLPDNLPVYNPSKHLRQLDGVDIVEVPFNVSPFEFISKLRRKLGDHTTIDGLRIEVARWKETMVAAYPIMFPIYVAEFEHTPSNGETRRYTVIMDAHDDNVNDCRVTFPPPEEMRESSRLAKNYYVNPAPFLPSANLILPALPMSPFEATHPPTAVMAKAYQSWMSPEPTGSSIPASPTYSVSDTPIDWSDPRILAWGSVEHEQNGEYMEKGLEVNRNIEALRAMTAISDHIPQGADTMITVGKLERGGRGPTFSKQSLSDVHRDVEEKIRSQKEELEDLKPGWLRAYDAAQAKKAEEQKEKKVKKAEDGATQSAESTESTST